jgi:hypothetical protein
VGLHDRKGRAAAHEVAVVATPGVVVLQPALELGVEVGQASEVLAVEGGPVELLERGALEAFADRVVVGGAGRDAMVADTETGKVAGERLGGELRAVVSEDPGELDPDAGQPRSDVVDEAGGVTGRLVPATRAPIP